jgi:hypothetical protein
MSAVDHIGKTQFIWWQGVVEDVMDPMKVGRVRVRIIGYHNPNKDELATKDLPWALPIMPVTSASTTGIGHSATGLVPGSLVIGFFRDGALGQQPIIFGSIPGIPLEGPPGSSFGYGDPRLLSATAGLYLPNEDMLGATGTIGKFAPRSGHYVGPTFDPGGGVFGLKGTKTVGGIAKYEYDFYNKGVSHENSYYGNIYPRYWGGPTGSISPITDTNTLAGGCGPTHGSKILQQYIIDRASIGTVLPVPKFRPFYELPLIGYDIANIMAESGDQSVFTPEGVKKIDLGAGGGFRAGPNLFGVFGALPPIRRDDEQEEDPQSILAGDDQPSPFFGFETTTSLRGNEFFERIFGSTSNYVETKIGPDGKEEYTVDENSPWIFTPPKGTTATRVYPFNHVYETESGHIMEFDDTNGGERIKIAHRLGTSEEVIEDGSKIEQVVNDKYTRVLGDNNTVVGGNSIFFGERGFKAIINAEALFYPKNPLEGRPTALGNQDQEDPFVYGPGFLGTGETGGPGWWGAEEELPDGTQPGGSQFFIDQQRERDIFSGNYKIELPQGVELDEDVEFKGGYRGLPRMNFFKGGNTDIIVAYGNVNLHIMRGNANLRVDRGDANLEIIKGDLRSYVGGNHFQRIEGNEIRYIAGNKYDIVQGKAKTVAKEEEITTRGAAGLLNTYVSLDFTLRDPGGESPIASPAQNGGPIQGTPISPGGSEQEQRGLINGQASFGGGIGGIVGGI